MSKSNTSEMIASYAIKRSNEPERAYKITTITQLQKFNAIFSLNEGIYPAIYVDMFGMMTRISIDKEQDLKNVGYDIITI